MNDNSNYSKLVCVNSGDEELIMPTEDLLGLRVVSMATGADEGSLFDNLHHQQIIMIQYDLQESIVTSGEDNRICIMDKFLNRTYVSTPSSMTSYCQTKNQNYHFTGLNDQTVIVWSEEWN